MRMRARRVMVLMTVLLLLACIETIWARSASATQHTQQVHLQPGLERPLPKYNPARVAAQTAAGMTIPMWSSSTVASQDGQSYNFDMVGQNPQVPLSNPATTIVVDVIPIVFKFLKDHNVKFDPTKATCGEPSSPVALTVESPIFRSTAFSAGGTNVGTTQYGDAFQRANFWAYTQPGGINPGYHVMLTPKVERKITLKVPANEGEVIPGTSGCGSEAAITETFAESFGSVLSRVTAKPWNVTPRTFPLLLFHNVVIAAGALQGPFVEGVHVAFPSPDPRFGGAPQTAGFADYDDSGQNEHATDVAVISHEIGEWMDDPLLTNSTPSWGNVGQDVGACQNNLEVGDPLTGNELPVPFNGFTYHLQDLAFFSWFYGPSPSIAVNGWYSFNNSFTRYSQSCPPGGP